MSEEKKYTKKTKKNLERFIEIAKDENVRTYSDFYRAANISPSTFYKWVSKRNEDRWMEFCDSVLSVLEVKREEMLDIAESKLGELINAGDFSAIRFILSTVGRSRGYGNNLSIDAEIDAEITIDLSK